MGASTDELVDIVLDIDWDKEPQCSARVHPTDKWHDGAASYWCVAPHGIRGLVCARWATAVRKLGVRCNLCGAIHQPEEFTFIEL